MADIYKRPLGSVTIEGTVPVTVTGTVVVTGGLTDAELRASPVPVTFPLPADAATLTAQTAGNASLASIDAKLTNPLPVSISGTIPVSGPLTDAQLRAVAVPVSGAFFQATQPVSIAASVAVTGPLTDTQLRASAVPVSFAAPVAVTGPLTNAELRATPVPVSGPLTDAQLRATPVPVSGTVSSTTTSSAGAVSTVSVSSTSTQLLAANANRKGFIVTNVGGNACFIGLGFTPTTSSYSFQLNTSFPNDTMKVTDIAFTGVINAIRASGTTNVLITELT
jgi:hypothetical protein